MIFHLLAGSANLHLPLKIVAKDKILFAETQPGANQSTDVKIAFAGHEDLLIKNLTKEAAHQLLRELGGISVPGIS